MLKDSNLMLSYAKTCQNLDLSEVNILHVKYPSIAMQIDRVDIT